MRVASTSVLEFTRLFAGGRWIRTTGTAAQKPWISLQIIGLLEKCGWPRAAFWPHGGHLFCLHVVAALGLGGAEVNPLCFQPFGGYGDETNVANGTAIPPELPGIGFETKPSLRDLWPLLSTFDQREAAIRHRLTTAYNTSLHSSLGTTN